MSGIVNDEVRARAARAQSAGILAKPFAAEDLVRYLDGLLTQAPPARPSTEPAPAARETMPAARETMPPVREPMPTMREPIPAFRESAPPARESMPTAEPAPAPREAVPVADGVTAILAQFAAMDGVQWAVLADREGFVVDATTNAGVDADVAAALSACLAESSDGLGRELGRGALQGLILEYEKGMIVLYSVANSGLLAVSIGEPSVLGKVRYFARRALPELARGM
jgi:predicted regulator of Ras-like GTPase activity (Roadblock/LC7/MglB family)